MCHYFDKDSQGSLHLVGKKDVNEHYGIMNILAARGQKQGIMNDKQM